MSRNSIRFALAGGLVAASGPVHASPPFKHIIIVFQENRTPDNIFGSNPSFEPGVDIATVGVNSKGKSIQLTALPLDDCYDISHTHSGFELTLTKGADQDPTSSKAGCTVPANPQYKYVDNSTGTVQPYFDIAENYGFGNRMFQTNQGPSFPAHQFVFGGTSSPGTESPDFAAENMEYTSQGAGCAVPATQRVAIIKPNGTEVTPGIFPCFTRPTMAELLDKAGLSWTYYAPGPTSIWTAPAAISQICKAGTVNGALACTGSVWTKHVVPDNPSQILTDISGCRLAAVNWVIPTASESDHAGVNTGLGPAWVASIVDALGNNPACGKGKEVYWTDTAIIITWDDWGGWFDHVKPFAVNAAPNWGAGYTYGFRVPLLVVSAYTPAGTVSNSTYDFGSILYFIETNFGLGFIGPGDTVYSTYADQHAASRGALSDFFTLTAPRGFVPIATSATPQFFLDQPKDGVGPDDD
jgi:phospholipase C